MSSCSCVAVPSPAAAAANEAIREFVRAHGDRPWGEAESAELHRLRGVWLASLRADDDVLDMSQRAALN